VALVPLVPIAASLAPATPPTPEKWLSEPSTAQAEELTSISEQQLDPFEQLIVDVARLLGSNDLGKIGANLYAGRSYWKVYGEQFPTTPRSSSNMVDLFSQSFKNRGKPNCLGYTSTGPNHKYLGIVFENFGAFSSPGVSGLSMVVVGVDPRVDDFKSGLLHGNRIYWVDEILSSDVTRVKGEIKPCPGLSKIAEPKPETNPKESPKVPKDIAQTKILYIAMESGKTKIYSSNPDGSDKQELVDKENIFGNPRWIDSKRFVYGTGGLGPKFGIFLYDIQTNKEIQLTFGQTGGIEMCAAPDGKGGIVFTARGVFPGKGANEDIFKIGLDGKNLERLTDDKVGSNEHCPIVSPDGKYIAFQVYSPGQHGIPVDIAIYPIERLKNDFSPPNHSMFIDGSEAIDWSPDNQWLLFTREVKLGPPRGYRYDLFKVHPDGTGETLVVKDAEGGSWSNDGKWVIYSSRREDEKNLDLYLVSSDGGESVKITNTSYNEFSPSWQPREKIVREERDILIVFGLITEIKDGYETHGLTRNFENWATTEYKYGKKNILRMSWGGWEFDNDGNLKSRDQACTDTLKDPNLRADMLIQMWNDLENKRPNRKLTVVTQSEGVVPTFLALKKGMKGEAKVNLEQIEKIIFVSPPAHGVDKPIFDKLAALWPVEQPETCRILFGATPSPSILEYPTGENLLKMWENRKSVDKEWAEVTAWLAKNGVEVYSLYNFEDGIISFRTLPIPQEILELMFFKGGKLTEVIKSQEIPGAINIGRSLGKGGLGHDRFWNTPEGLEILMTIVGEQIKRTGGDLNAILWELRRELFVRLNKAVLNQTKGLKG